MLPGRTPKGYSCNICSKTYKTPKILRQHLKLHDPIYKLRYKCKICKKGYPKMHRLTNHMITHTNVKPHKCFVCEKTFHLKQSLKSHLKVHKPNRMIQCLQCKAYYAGQGSLKQHRIRMHKGLSAENPIVIDQWLCSVTLMTANNNKLAKKVHPNYIKWWGI